SLRVGPALGQTGEHPLHQFRRAFVGKRATDDSAHWSVKLVRVALAGRLFFPRPQFMPRARDQAQVLVQRIAFLPLGEHLVNSSDRIVGQLRPGKRHARWMAALAQLIEIPFALEQPAPDLADEETKLGESLLVQREEKELRANEPLELAH